MHHSKTPALLFIALTFILNSCRDINKTTLYNIERNEKILIQSTKLKYVNGKLNYYLTLVSNNSTKLILGNLTKEGLDKKRKIIYLGNALVEDVIFSENPENYCILISSNSSKYVIYQNKLLTEKVPLEKVPLENVPLENEILLRKDGVTILPKENHVKSNILQDNPNVRIFQKGNFKYISYVSGKEFGPFIDVEIPYQTIDKKNWWVTAKNINSNYTIIINSKLILDDVQEIGIPSFYETNFILSAKKNNKNYVIVNGKTLEIPSEEIEQPTFYKSNWIVITKSSNKYKLILGEINNNTLKTLYSSTNKISYPLIDRNGNTWIIEEGDKKNYLIKNYNKIIGEYYKILYFQNIHKDTVFLCKTNDHWFVVKENKLYGAFKSVGEIIFDKNKLIFSFSSNNQNYVFIEGTNIGPYEKVLNISIEESTPIITYKKEGKEYVLLFNVCNLGPYDEVFWNTFSYKNKRFLFTFRNGNDLYINYSSKVYGPYKNIYTPVLSENGRIWGAGVMDHDGLFSLIFNGIVIGKYIGVDYESIKFDATNGIWSGITQKTNGFYITTTFFEKGPFEKIFQLKVSKDLKKAKFSVKKNKDVYVYFTEKDKVTKKLGPYKMALFVSENFDSNLLLVLKENNKYFILKDKLTLGPYDYIKDIKEENNNFYFVYGIDNKEGINVNGKDIAKFSRIVKYNNFLGDSWYAIVYHKNNYFLYTSTNGITNLVNIFLNKELLNVNKKFSFVLKNNEWQFLIIDNKEIGPFNFIDKDSLIYNNKSKFAFIARKNKEKYLVSNNETFGPYDDIIKFLVLEKDIISLIEDSGNRYLKVNNKKIETGVIDFDIDYTRRNVSLLVLNGKKVIIKTMKLADLLLHRN